MSDFEIIDGKLIKVNIVGDSVVVPVGVKVIGGSAFGWDLQLKTITLQEGVEEIEGFAFDNSLNRTTIYLPKTLKKIKANAFFRFRATTKVEYAGTSEEFKQIRIEPMGGNRDFIRYMEAKLGLESRFKPPKKVENVASKEDVMASLGLTATTKKGQICEYADKLAKQFNIERIDKDKLGLDMWHNVILELEGSMTVKDNLINIAASNEILKLGEYDYIEREKLANQRILSVESARTLGKIKLNKKMEGYCRGVALKYLGDAKRDADKIIYKKVTPKWNKMRATNIYEIPVEMLDVSGKISDNEPPKFEDGKWVLDADKCESSIAHYYFPESLLSKKGNIILPLRLRITSDNVPKNDNIYGSMRDKRCDNLLDSEYYCESCEHNYKDYYYFDFYIDDVKHSFCIMLTGYSGISRILEYKIGNDDEGYYIDALFKMEVSRFIYY